MVFWWKEAVELSVSRRKQSTRQEAKSLAFNAYFGAVLDFEQAGASLPKDYRESTGNPPRSCMSYAVGYE